MVLFRLGCKLTLARLRRVVLFVCLILLLCATAGALGSFLLYSEQAVDTVTLVIVDEDDTMESRLFFNLISEAIEYEGLLEFERTDADSARNRLLSGEVSAIFTIPPGFTQSVLIGDNDPFGIVLDENSPLVASLVQLFVDAYTDMLHAGQLGVFSALDIARDVGGSEAYNTMFRVSNLRFISAMLNRSQIKQDELVSAVGATPVALYYGAAAFVFLLLLGSVLFLDLFVRIVDRPVLLRLRSQGRGSPGCAVGALGSAFLPFALVAVLCMVALGVAARRWELGFVLTPALVVSALLCALVAAAFGLAVSLLLRHETVGCVFVTLYSLFCLFLSGGVLPTVYLSAPLQALGRLTPHYWLSRLLTESAVGAPSGAALGGSLLVFVLLAVLCGVGVHLRGRVGKTP